MLSHIINKQIYHKYINYISTKLKKCKMIYFKKNNFYLKMI